MAAAIKTKTGRQVACSKTIIAKPEHADKVAEMLQDVVREHYGPLSTPLPRARSMSGSALLPPTVDITPPLPSAAAADTDASAATSPSSPPQATAITVDPDLPRLLAFRAERDAWEPHVFHLWLQAGSNEALGRIDTAPRAARFMRDALPLLERPVGMCMYTLNPDGSLGAPAMQGGPKGEGGLDDATGASGMVGAGAGGQTSAALAAMVAQAMSEQHEGEGGGGGKGPAAGVGKLLGSPEAAGVAASAVAIGLAAAAVWWLWLGGGGGGGSVGTPLL